MISLFLHKHQTPILVAVVSFFILLRVGLLLYGHIHISHPAFDETASGRLACDLLDGRLKGPLFTYQYEQYSGDSLLEGLLLVPFFKIIGRSLFSLKIFALLSTLLSLILWLLFLQKYSGRWTAIIFGLLFVFAPTMFVRLNFLGTVASHHMINPFIAAQLIILFKIIEKEKEGVPLFLWLVFGFVAGLGSYLFYTYIIFNCFCVVFLLAFRLSSLTVRRIACFLAGCAIGFAPWLMQLTYSSKGGSFLANILQHMRIDFWGFVQNFCFSIPHSFGYDYPLRTIGLTSIAFSLFLFLFVCVLLKNFQPSVSSLSGYLFRNKLYGLPTSGLQGVFVGLFPVFFIVCLTLSPKQLNPFAYVPFIGLFAHLGCDDAYRYRWLYSLYPFYFAIISVGASTVFERSNKTVILKFTTVAGLVFFILCGAVQTLNFYERNNFGKIFYYKGYNNDRLASRLISPVALRDYKLAQKITANYPDDNRAEAYKYLGKAAISFMRNSSGKEKSFHASLSEVPQQYMDSFIYGAIWAFQDETEKEFRTFRLVIEKEYPDVFYTMWGYRFIGYKYYGFLINHAKLMEEIPPVEQWFFKTFIKRFKQTTQFSETALMEEIRAIPEAYQYDAVKGLGMLVGAQMLFDPMFTPDYPLDSRFGKKLDSNFQAVFYQGVGSGFAETLCRFWRKLLPPAEVSPLCYQKMLEVEWQRCNMLMSQLPANVQPNLIKGFREELQKRSYLNAGTRELIDKKFKKGWIPGN